MNLPSLFCTEARNAFALSKVLGEFVGIDVENGIAHIIYTTPAGKTEKMIWTHAAGVWEGIFRTMTNHHN